MAAASGLLSEERFLCSVCLDVFTEPVSTPCGHNFCRACIRKYWDNSDSCQCPLCKRTFSTRPELQVNTLMSELAGEFEKLGKVKASTLDPQFAADVFCDICAETKEKAVKSCLMCLVSFCEAHLEPHQRVPALRSHTLLDPMKHLDDKLCKTHNKITELFCQDDQACVCVLCLKTDHKSHNVVPLEEEYETVMAGKDDAIATIQKQIRSRSEKIAEIENSLDVCQKEAEKEKKASLQVLTELISSFQRSLAELVEVIEERHRGAKEKAEASVKELRMEISELESRRNQLEQLSQSEDHHHFLQSFPTLSSPLNTDRTSIVVWCDLHFEAVRGDVALLKQKSDQLLDKIPEIKMKRMREHAVDLTLDPDTAHCSLVISKDGKQVADEGTILQLPNNPKRFEKFPEVLAKEGFTTGKFYFEVQVKGKTGWILGVVRESVDRKNDTDLSVEDGFWTLVLDGGQYSACRSHIVTPKGELQKVGVFVDYNEGVVSFYDVDSKSHVYSFIDCNFTETLYPYFCPVAYQVGKNAAPLIITPVL